MTEESKDFFKSDVVRESLEDIQTTYTELLKMSAGSVSYTHLTLPTNREV